MVINKQVEGQSINLSKDKVAILKYDLKVIEQKIQQLIQKKTEIEHELGTIDN